MSAASSPANAPAASRDAGIDRMRRASLGALVALLIEYGLGIGVNLFVNVPDADQGSGMGAAFGKAMSNGPAALAVHAGIGLLLIINAVVVLVQALMSRTRLAAVISAVAFLCVLGAAFSGATFVDKGQDSASMTMAALTGVALFCYALNLYTLGAREN
ncbi:MAG: hypothetical protein ACRDVE_20170 [Actinocrinis sp.]